jgi:hypothetical protein
MTDKPKRVQLSRKAGWRMPPNTVKVDRSTRWGNPFRVGVGGCATAAEAASAYRCLMLSEGRDVTPLHGRNVACWCRLDQPCHGDVLLELANR